MYGVTIESPIESPMGSLTSLTHQVVEYRIDLTEGTFTLLKPTIYPGPHDLVRHSLLRLELVHSNSDGSGELPSHYLLPEMTPTLPLSRTRMQTPRVTTSLKPGGRDVNIVK